MSLKTPVIRSFSQASGSLRSSATDTLAWELSGIAPENSVVSLFDDTGLLGTTISDASGGWIFKTPFSASSSFTATATDATGKTSGRSSPFNVSASVPETQAFVLAAASFTSAPSLAVADTSDHVINAAESTDVAFTVAGLPVGAPGTVTFTDTSSHQVVVNVDGNGIFSANLSSLADGAVSSVLTAADGTGFNAAADGNTVALDTDSGLNPSLSVNAANPSNVVFTVSGLESDYSGTVTFTDSSGKSDVVRIGANGTYSANLSNLTDGTLTYLMTVSDPAGNVINVDPTVTLGDGSANAPAGTPQLPNLLNGYAIRAPWMVAGVDYAVGVPSGTTLKDPSTISMAGVSVNTTSHVVTVTGNNVTLNGYDFSLSGGWQVYVTGANAVIENSNFAVGANNKIPIQSSTAASNLTVVDCAFDGGGASRSEQALIYFTGSGTFVSEYNLFQNAPSDAIDLNPASPSLTPTVSFNVFDNLGLLSGAHGDVVQFVGGAVNNYVETYNTIYQPATNTDGLEGIQIDAQGGASISNSTVSNNTIIAPMGAAKGDTMSWMVTLGSSAGNSLNNTLISNNYLVPTGAGGVFYPLNYANAPTNTVANNNVDMVTGNYINLNNLEVAQTTVTSVVSSPSSGTEFPGNTVALVAIFSAAVTVSGTPTLTLNDGGTATYTGGSGTNALTFTYTVAPTDTTVSALAITQVNLPSGATIKDGNGNTPNLAGAIATFPNLAIDPPTAGATLTAITESPSTADLNVGKTVTFTLNLSSAVTVTAGTPTLTLNDGGTATYTGGSGTSALTFSYTVGATDANVAALSATAVGLNGATIKDGSGNVASLSLSGITQMGPQIDTTTPAVSSVVSSPATGTELAGSTVTLTLNLSEAVTVAGGTPTLKLNDGGSATYTGGSGTNKLTFSYTVGASDTAVSALGITQVNLPTGVTITDGAGNAANLAGALTTLSGLAINPSASGYNDGSSGAPSGTPQLANLLNGYAASDKPAWMVAGVNYAVGVATGTTLKDPTIAANLPAGVSIDSTNHVIDITGNNVTLNGFDFSLHGGWGIYVQSGVTGTIIENCNFSMLASQPVAIDAATGSGSLTVLNCTFNGNSENIPSVLPPPSGTGVGAAIIDNGSGTFTGKYNYIYNMPSDGIDFDVGTVTPTIEYNVFQNLGMTPGAHPDPVQFYADNVNNAMIAFNTVYSAQAGESVNEGLTIEAQGGATISNTTIENNVIVATGPTMTQSLNMGVFQDSGNVISGLVVKDNYLDPTGTYTSTGFGSGASAPTGSNLVFTNNVSMLTGAVTAPAGGTFNTSDVTSVTASPSSGTETAGNTITFTISTDEPFTVTGTPTLTLNDGGTATYTGGSGTKTLSFSYTVGASDTAVSSLAITKVNLPSGATIVDANGNTANLAGALTTFSGLQISASSSPLTVSSVVASGSGITSGTGDLGAGSLVTLTVNLSAPATVAGGTPTLTLNDGGTATYAGGSGSNALTFNYTVAAGQNTPDLTVTAVNLNGATIKDGTGNLANLAGAVTNPSGTLQIDTTTPTVSSVAASGTGITAGGGDLGTGSAVTLTVNLSEAVTVAGGTPTLTLNDGGTASYTGGSGSNALTFTYTVAAGQNTSDLAVTAVSLNGASVTNGAGTAANLAGAVTNPSGTLQIDTMTPTVSSVATSGTGITAGTGDLAAGSVVTLTMNLNEAVTVAGGTPTLTLNDGGTATYTSGSGTNALTFRYTVAAGQNTPDLAVSAVNLNGATVKNGAGTAANLAGAVTTPSGTLQIDTTAPTVSQVTASPGTGTELPGNTVTFTMAFSEAVSVTGTPTLSLNDGGTATYTSGSGTNLLTFSYTVGANDSAVSALAITQANLPNGATIKDGAGNAANLSGAVTTFSGLATDPPVHVNSLTDSPSTGDLNAGKTVTLTLNLSGPVTVAGGTPTLLLNDGGIATYTGGSGTNALSFNYTVSSSDTNVASLAATGLSLNGATLLDSGGNTASLSLTGLTQTGPQIDTTTPVISTIAETPANGDLNAGKIVTYTLTMSEVVTVNTSGGKPTLALNDGGTATYVSGSGTNALTFSYTVQAGQNTPDLMVSAFNLNGASITDGAGNAANVSLAGIAQGSPAIDTTPPTVASVTAAAGDYDAGKALTLTLNMSEAVNVTGTPTLTLNDGGTATYVSGSGSSTLVFSYAVGSGQNTSALAVTGVTGTIADLAGNALSTSGLPQTFTGVIVDTTAPTVSSVATSGTGITAGSGDLGTGSVVTLTVNLSEAVTVAGGTPTLTLNDGGTATYVGGSGSNALTFSYTVAAGQSTPDLTVTAVNLNGATVRDGAGNAANLAGAVSNPAGTLQIDSTLPTVASVATSGTGITAGTGDLAAGSVVTLTVNLSKAVTVAGGTPTLSLNDGGTATFTGGSGTNALTFSYTVGAGQNTSDLAVAGISLNGATVQDALGNAANLSGAVANPTGTLQIDTTTPTVSAVATSGTGITAGLGDLGTGGVVTLTVNLSEAVTVAGGTPTLTLNDGGTATYTGGSGSNALKFSYTVAAGQNTPDLAVTAVNLNGATIKNGAGTAASLTGAVSNPAGTLQIDTTTAAVSAVASSGAGITAGAGDLAAGSVVTLTVNLSEVVTVAGGTPTLSLNDGGTATYTGGSGTNGLTFSYTVAAGQNTPDLSVTAINLNGATVKNGAGTAANLTGAVTNPSGTLQIDTMAPIVSSVVASGTGIKNGAATLGAGAVAMLTVNLSEAVTVSGGVPTLSLNDGGIATYTGGSGGNALTFSYTVAAGQNTNDLSVTAVNLNGATVADAAGNAANLAGAITNPQGKLKIYTGTQKVVSTSTTTSGTTSLVAIGSEYALNTSGSTAVIGPELSYNGTPVTAGEFGSWTPIATVQTASGYDVAWQIAGTNQYAIWSTDSSGNYVSNLTPLLAGNTTAFEAFETTFGQDLNGDGTIGVKTTLIQTDGTTSLVQYGNNYALNAVGSSTTGPLLKYNGSVVTVGGLGGWTPIGAVQTASGYDIAWQVAGTNQYTIWSTDSSGNYLSNLAPVLAGNSSALEAFETTFQQDLNGDGTVGVPTTLIQTDGTTKLVEYGTNYALDTVGSNSTGPLLKYNGAVVTAGQLGSWTPIGAVQTATGYDIAWQVAGTNQYTVWSTDSSGNYLSNLAPVLAGNTTTLESFEATFQQDLNGDGVTGVKTVPIQTDGTTSLVEYGNNYALDAVGSSTTGPLLKYNGSVVTVGALGGWTPIGAVQTATGYDIAWQVSGTNQYTIWSTDSSGNYISNLAPVLTGNSTALQGFETTFQQDINRDGVITIPAGQTMELTGSYSGEIVFGGSTGSLKIDHAADFTGTIGGPLTPTDQIDFADINFNSATLGYSGNNSPGTLTVSDGTNTATLSVLGNHSLANFIASSDGHGGTIVVDPPLTGGSTNSLDQQMALFSQYMASAFPAGGTEPSTLVDSSETGVGIAPHMASPTPSQLHASMLS